MALLDENLQKQVQEQLAALPEPITLHLFTQELECHYCRENRNLAEEITALAKGKIKMQVHNFVTDKEVVEKYQIERIPAIALEGSQDYGIRFYGVPGGYEFTSLLSALKIVSTGKTQMSSSSLARLGAITNPIQIKVYVTPTCPYCPSAVHLAHQLAVASPLIRADMIEISEFPQLAMKDQVMGVPKIVVEGMGSFEGALPEMNFVNKILEMVTGGSV